MKQKSSQYIQIMSPKWKQFWILIDQDNGHLNGPTYFFVFGTKKEALIYRSKQHKMKFGARLSKPFKVTT